MGYSGTQKNIETDMPDNNEKLTVLIVDKRDGGNRLKKEIFRLGHIGLVAESYGDALKKVSENSYDLIVMDIDLPDENGIEAISKIRETAGDINIVTMTESNDREREHEVRDKRVLYYAVKPLEYKEIRSILDHILSKAKIIK